MSDSTRLGLPYLAGGQAQKHITVNESLLRLDALVQLSVKSATTTAQPGAPSDGALYILPAGKTGAAWGAMADGALAYYRDGVWEEIAPRHGFHALVEDTNQLHMRDAAAWRHIAGKDEHRLVFTPGGDGVVSIYRIDTSRAQNPRTATISSISGDVITLSTSDAGLFFNQTYMAGVSYVRVWNTSKTPNQSAWVKACPASNQLTVVSAAALTGWTNGETLQIGDPTGITPNRVIALDISPMLQAVLGRVFPQAGVQLRGLVQSTASVQANIDSTPTGASGTFHGVKSFTDGTSQAGQFIIPTTMPSPISNSNLVFIREGASTTLNICGVSVLGVLV